MGIVLSRLRETHTAGNEGTLENVVVTSERQIFVIGAVDPDYSLVLQLERNCPVGLARYHFTTALTQLKKEL